MQSSAQVWIERFVIGVVALFSLLVPLVIGVLFYLALQDSIAINADDPVQQARLWMVRERRGATGLGLSITAAAAAPAGQICARTHVTFLKWDGALRIEPDVAYCRCYTRQAGVLVEAGEHCP
jgi:hypothetical protein